MAFREEGREAAVVSMLQMSPETCSVDNRHELCSTSSRASAVCGRMLSLAGFAICGF